MTAIVKPRVALILRMPSPMAHTSASCPKKIGSRRTPTGAITASFVPTTYATPAVRTSPANIHRKAWLRSAAPIAGDGWSPAWVQGVVEVVGKLTDCLLAIRSSGVQSAAPVRDARPGRASPSAILQLRRPAPGPTRGPPAGSGTGSSTGRGRGHLRPGPRSGVRPVGGLSGRDLAK